MRRGKTYSRAIAWLKILLPMTALGLLSTVFLLSKEVANVGDIPFADTDFRNRAANQQVTAPRYFGTTAKGETIELVAEAARPSVNDSEQLDAEEVRLTLASDSQGDIIALSQSVEISLAENSAVLDGGVLIDSSAGYSLNADALRTSFSVVDAETLGPVTGHGPPGTLSAGKLVVRSTPEGDIQLLFTEGVKLVYEPQHQKE